MSIRLSIKTVYQLYDIDPSAKEVIDQFHLSQLILNVNNGNNKRIEPHMYYDKETDKFFNEWQFIL